MNDPTAEDELEETERINVVPLADLTLVLLIILMVLSPMISQSMIHVAAPAVANGGNFPAALDIHFPDGLYLKQRVGPQPGSPHGRHGHPAQREPQAPGDHHRGGRGARGPSGGSAGLR